MIGLNIDEKHLPGVILNLDIAAEMSNSLDALIIKDDDSMAISFTLSSPLMIDGTEDASAIAKAVRDRKTSAVDVIKNCLQRIATYDPW